MKWRLVPVILLALLFAAPAAIGTHAPSFEEKSTWCGWVPCDLTITGTATPASGCFDTICPLELKPTVTVGLIPGLAGLRVTFVGESELVVCIPEQQCPPYSSAPRTRVCSDLAITVTGRVSCTGSVTTGYVDLAPAPGTCDYFGRLETVYYYGYVMATASHSSWLYYCSDAGGNHYVDLR